MPRVQAPDPTPRALATALDGPGGRGAKRAYRGEARAEKKQQTQARVLEAALQLFSELGFEAASVRDIAQRAGVSHAAIRLHYGTKEELWKASVVFLFRRMGEQTPLPDMQVALENPRQALENVVRGYVSYCARHPEHVRMMVQESIRDSSRLSWMARNFIGPAHEGLQPLLKAAIRDNVLPDVPLTSLTYIVAGAAQTISMLAAEAKIIYGLDTLHPSVVKQHSDAIIKVFFRDETSNEG